jgi:preprotein translocase subunit SecG
MSIWFLVLTVFFIIVAVAMVLIILVQRTQGGGLAGAFGGAGGTGAETVFGGRIGDALTWATVIAFAIYIGLAIALNLVESKPLPANAVSPAAQIGASSDGASPTALPAAAPTDLPDFSLPDPASPGGAPTSPPGTSGSGGGGSE